MSLFQRPPCAFCEEPLGEDWEKVVLATKDGKKTIKVCSRCGEFLEERAADDPFAEIKPMEEGDL